MTTGSVALQMRDRFFYLGKLERSVAFLSLYFYFGEDNDSVHIPPLIITAGCSHSFFASGFLSFLFHRGAGRH